MELLKLISLKFTVGFQFIITNEKISVLNKSSQRIAIISNKVELITDKNEVELLSKLFDVDDSDLTLLCYCFNKIVEANLPLEELELLFPFFSSNITLNEN